MGTENKVHFNLKNVHVAVATEEDGETSYATPLAIPGAVSINLSINGDRNVFYADGIEYYIMNTNSGYDGDLEVARFPEAVYKALWGYIQDTTTKILYESAEAAQVRFALGFQIDGDVNETLYWMLNCTGTRPNIASQTNEESKTPQTQTSTIAARPNAEGFVVAKSSSDTGADAKAAWFSAVVDPAPTVGP